MAPRTVYSPAIQSSLTSISGTPFNPKTIIIHLPLPFLLLYLFLPWLSQFLPSSTDSSSDKGNGFDPFRHSVSAKFIPLFSPFVFVFVYRILAAFVPLILPGLDWLIFANGFGWLMWGNHLGFFFCPFRLENASFTCSCLWGDLGFRDPNKTGRLLFTSVSNFIWGALFLCHLSTTEQFCAAMKTPSQLFWLWWPTFWENNHDAYNGFEIRWQ